MNQMYAEILMLKSGGVVITLPTRQRLHFLTLKSQHTCVYWVHVLHTCMCSITVCVRRVIHTYVCVHMYMYVHIHDM